MANPTLYAFEIELEPTSDLPPVTTLLTGPGVNTSEWTNDSTPTYTFRADDPESSDVRFEWRLDSGTWNDVNGGEYYASGETVEFTLPTTDDGDYELQIRAFDGTQYGDAATCDLRIDTVKPSASIDSAPPDPTNDSTPTFEFSGSDDRTPEGSLTFEGRIDGGEWTTQTSPWTLPAQSHGPHTVEVRSKDLATNYSDPATWTGKIDLVPPGLIAPFVATRTGDTTIRLDWLETGDDENVGTAAAREFRYRNDGEAVTDANWATSTVMLPGDVEGGVFPAMAAAGTPRTMVFISADMEHEWSFGCRVTDAATNEGATASSNIVSPDEEAPGRIRGVWAEPAVGENGQTQMVLHWIETGDDGDTGTATTRQIRYRTTSEVTEATFPTDSPIPNHDEQPACQPAGTPMQMTVTGLEPGTTYWFGIRALDEASNAGPVGASAMAMTFDFSESGGGGGALRASAIRK